MKKVLFLFLVIGIIAAFSISSVQAKIVLKAGHISPKTSNEGKAADKFAELVAKKTNGEIVVEMFPSEQLGKAVAMIDSTVMGNQDIYVGGNVEFERFSPGLKVLGLNYSVRDQDHFRKVLASPIWKEVFIDPLEKVGLKVLDSDWERGPFRVLVSKRPVKSCNDLQGLRLRIAPLDTWRRSWTALGCNPVVLPWTDVYLGLQQGMVEAVTAPFDLLYSMKFTEIAKYVARTDEYWGLLTVEMNKKKFDGLKPEFQKALVDAANEAGNFYMELGAKSVNEDLEKMKKEHGIEYIVLDTKPCAEKMKPVIQQLEKEGFIPAGLYDRIQALK
ncbi:MAG: TRAP transporter substrate-binding protein [Deltaproteobacteria bacterium]|nr:TRAP transporter substrate-binding protein [Deltaproteobacteria bacterium]